MGEMAAEMSSRLKLALLRVENIRSMKLQIGQDTKYSRLIGEMGALYYEPFYPDLCC